MYSDSQFSLFFSDVARVAELKWQMILQTASFTVSSSEQETEISLRFSEGSSDGCRSGQAEVEI